MIIEVRSYLIYRVFCLNMVMIGIYKITNPKGKIYIGQSKDIDRRYDEYSRNKVARQTKIYNSINKYGWENHTFEIVEECEIGDLNCRERYWQDYYDCCNREKGLNLVLSSCGENTTIISEEVKNLISNSLVEYNKNIDQPIYQYNLKGDLVKIWKNFYEIRHYSDFNAGYIGKCCGDRCKSAYEFFWSFEERVYSKKYIETFGTTKSEKLRGHKHNLGRILTEEHKEKLRKASTGFKHSDEAKDIISKNNSKAVDQYDKEGNFLKTWDSITLAAESLGVRFGANISSCALGKIKTAYGYKWEYNK